MNEAFSRQPLGEILVENGFASEDDIQQALQDKSVPLGEALLSHHKITDEQLAQALAAQCGYPYLDLADHVVSDEMFKTFSAEHAFKFAVVPYRISGQQIDIAAADPFDLSLAERIEKQTGLDVNLFIASQSGIQQCLKRSEGSFELLKGLSKDFQLMRVVETAQGDQQQISLDADASPDDGPVIKLVNSVILAALNKQASDIHIEATTHGTDVKYRIDGVLYPATETLDRKHHNELVSRIKIMSELDITEKRTPQDGRFRLRYSARDIDFRVSVLPSVYGEDIAIRVLDRSAVNNEFDTLSLESLGLDESIKAEFARAVHHPYGMILVTGPTGSGKTTTLYAALKTLDLTHEKVITIEDPVEYQLDGITQIPVNEKKGLTFGTGLRSILRHDPDKIMVGEIRDEETARIALQSALTGHLVFTTVHANDSIDVIERFRYMGIDVYELTSAITCVMAQRLVRKLCPHCKQVMDKNELAEFDWLGDTPSQSKKSNKATKGGKTNKTKQSEKPETGQWAKATGCDICLHTGYAGRTLITEFLPFSADLKQHMIDRLPTHQLKAQAIAQGMITLRQSAINLAKQGITSLAEVQRVTFG